MWIISNICPKAILISNNYELSAEISSLFNNPNEYFTILEEPRDWDILTDNQVTIVSNAIAYIRPEYTILCDISEKIEKLIIARFPSKESLIIIKNRQDIEEKIIKRFKLSLEPYYCNPNELALWLIYAKSKQKHLIPKEKESIKFKESYVKWKSTKIVLFEQNNDVLDIISANYAFAEEDTLASIASFTRKQVENISQNIKATWNNETLKEKAKLDKFKNIKSQIKARLPIKINFKSYHTALFITEGIPYSFALDNIIPIAHLLRNFLWLAFINSYINTREILPISGNAVLFSTKDFNNWDEMDSVEHQLKNKNYTLQRLYWKYATISNFNNYVSFLPYDILHIWTHWWDLSWCNILEEFTDDKWEKHTIEYNEIRIIENPLALNNTKPDTEIPVSIFHSFIEYDWVKWDNIKESNWLKHRMRNVHRGEYSLKNRRILKSEPTNDIDNSQSIMCFDWPNMCAFHSIANHRRPFIFNNSCSSFYDLSSKFSYAWARWYIWTLWNVEEDVAKEVSEDFYQNINSMTLYWAIRHAQRIIKKPTQKNIYIYFWTDLDCIFKVEEFHKAHYIYELNQAIIRWKECILRNKNNEDVIKNSEKAISFLNWHIVFEKIKNIWIYNNHYYYNSFYNK